MILRSYGTVSCKIPERQGQSQLSARLDHEIFHLTFGSELLIRTKSPVHPGWTVFQFKSSYKRLHKL